MLKRIFLILITVFCLSTSVFAIPKNNSSQPIRETIIKTYSSWDEWRAAGDFIVENNIKYPSIFAERIGNKSIVAQYEIPTTITKKYSSWDEWRSAKDFIVQNNVTYELIKGTKLKWSSDILAVYQIKGV